MKMFTRLPDRYQAHRHHHGNTVLTDEAIAFYASHEDPVNHDLQIMAAELLMLREQIRKFQIESWRHAPKWAKWRARDSDGRLFYYQERPTLMQFEWRPEDANLNTLYCHAEGMSGNIPSNLALTKHPSRNHFHASFSFSTGFFTAIQPGPSWRMAQGDFS